jgi:ATP-dependent DNA helicase RecG
MYKTKGFFVITFKRPDREVTTPKEENIVPLTDIQKAILQLMRDNSKITFDDMEQSLSISRKKLNEQINLLKEQKLIERIGSRKFGEWLVL